jgi:lysozyme family protein
MSIMKQTHSCVRSVWDERIDDVIGREGKYTDDPVDRGGATIWGITEAEARAWGYAGPMRDMPRAEAERIYRARYVTGPGFDLIGEIDGPIAARLFDCGVNCGTGTAARFLQRVLNVLNDQGRLWLDLVVDGAAGQATRYALTQLIARRGAEGRRVVLAALAGLQGARYVEIAERDETQERFEWGWLVARAFPKGDIQ